MLKSCSFAPKLERSHLIDKLPRAHKAAFDSGRAGGLNSCFVGTRVAILDSIKSWLDSSDVTESRLFWLNGLAGIGKSTIARTIAELSKERGILGGSFFFSRDDSALRDGELVFPTLAFQLAQLDSTFKLAIGAALEVDPDCGHRTLPIQVEKLLIAPLETTPRSDRLVLFILDALDECGPDHRASEILRLFMTHAPRVPFRFRILLTSRPEPHIRTVFDEAPKHAKFILHDVEMSVVRRDIHLFVQAELSNIPKQLHVKVSSDWPRKIDVDTLADTSGKLFVYAATSVRFIGNERVRNPQKQIEILLGVRQATNAKPYAQLDQLYLQILRNALPADTEDDDIDRFHWVVGSIVLLRNPLSMDALAHFTRYDMDEVINALYHLQSIILIPSNLNEAPRIYHPSFPDFITSAQRCADVAVTNITSAGRSAGPTFAISIPEHETRLVLRCLELLDKSLKHDLLDIQDPSLLNSEIVSLDDQLEKALPAEVEYSCQYWASHLTRATLGDAAVVVQLEQFASVSLMWWFEAMSLLDAMNLAVSCMHEAHQWAVRSIFLVY